MREKSGIEEEEESEGYAKREKYSRQKHMRSKILLPKIIKVA